MRNPPNIVVSEGTSKMGRIANVSLLPIITCVSGCACRRHCYAHRITRRRPTVAVAWAKNTSLALVDPTQFFQQLSSWLEKHNPQRFRLHVGGDFPSQQYLDCAADTARSFPRTSFLAFTKRYTFDYRNIPANMHVVFSAWPGMELPTRTKEVPFIAWMQDGTETRIPKTSHQCKGNCSSCFECWNLKSDVVFKKH